MHGKTNETNPSTLSENVSILDQALEKSAQELKTLTLIYQAHGRPRKARETYAAFLRLVQSDVIDRAA